MEKKKPTIDLHCHLDGSLSIDVMRENLAKAGHIYSIEELKKKASVTPNCKSLTEYLTKFDIPIKSMYDYESTKSLSKSFMENLVEDNVSYIEVRFSPALIANGDYTDKFVLEAVLEGLKEGSCSTGIISNVIICAMRHHSIDANKRAFKLAREYVDSGVCGVDLAGDENFYPTSDFKELFSYASSLGLKYTIHAGECHSSKSIQDAIEMGAARIGHGIAMTGNVSIKKICIDKRIGVEMCPISNFQTGAVREHSSYPFIEFMNDNLFVTVNTDNRTVSDTTLTKEYEFLRKNFGLTNEEQRKLYINAVEVCFGSDEIKNSLLKINN